MIRAILFWSIWTIIAIVFLLFFILQLNLVLITNSPHYEKFYRNLLISRSGFNIERLEPSWQKASPRLSLQEISFNTNSISLEATKAAITITPIAYLSGEGFYQIILTDGAAMLANNQTRGNSGLLPNIQLINFTISAQEDSTISLLVQEGQIRHQTDRYLMGIRGDITHEETVLATIKSNIHLMKELPINSDFYIEVQNLVLPEGWLSMTDVIPLPQNTKDLLEDLHSMEGNGRLWVDIINGEIVRAKADMFFDKVVVANSIAMENIHILSGFEGFSDDRNEEWIWQIEHISLSYAGKELVFHNSSVIKHPSSYEIYVPHLNGGDFASLIVPFIENNAIRTEIADRQLSGELHNLHIEINTKKEDVPIFVLNAYLDRADVAAYRNMPGITGLSGQLYIEDTRGWLQLDAGQSSLHLVNLYTKPFELTRAQGFFAWNWLPERELILVGDVDNILNEGQEATLDLAMHIVPFEHDYIDLVIGMKNSPLHLAKSYIPDLIINQNLVQWLNTALEQGDVTEAAMAIHGDLKDFDSSQTLFELLINMEEVIFEYSVGIPALTTKQARIFLDKKDLAIVLPSGGKINGITTMNKAASRLNLRESDLHIKGSGDTSATALMVLLMRYAELPPDFLTGWELEGKFNGDWQFSYDLKNSQLEDISFAAAIEDARIQTPFLVNPLEQGKGTIGFSQERGYSGSVTIKLGDEELVGNFHNANERNYLKLIGELNSTDYIPAQLQTYNKNEYIRGKSLFTVDLSRPINGSLMFNRIEISSSLKGTAIKLPAPFQKAASAQTPISYRLDVSSGTRHQIAFANIGQLNWLYKHNSTQEVFVRFNSTIKDQGASALIVNLDSLNLTAWERAITLLSKTAQKEEQESTMTAQILPMLLRLQEEIPFWHIAVKKLEWQNKLYQDISIDYNSRQNPLVSFSHHHMISRLLLESDTIYIDISYLHLAPSRSTDRGAILPDKLPSFDFTSMPNIIVSLPYIVYNNSPLGEANLSIGFANNQMNVNARTLIGTPAETSIPINLAMRWKRLSSRDNHIELDLSSQGKITKPLGPIVESEDMSFTINLVWEGGNDAFVNWTRQATGNINLNLKDGLFASQQTTLLTNLFNLLNLANLQKRLRGDFTDISETNLAFDSINGEMLLMDGRLTIKNNAIGEFSFAEILTSGYYDLTNRSLNYQVIVSSPIAKTLPLTALLLGFSSLTPLLLSLDISSGDFLTRFSTATYKVGGLISQPEIRLTRVSDLQGTELSMEDLEKRIDIDQPLRNLRF